MRSSDATRYQLGLLRQAGSLIVPLSASRPHGTCESAMNAASSAGRSAAKDSANFSRSRNRKPSWGGRIGGTGALGGRVGDQRVDRLAGVGCERRDVDDAGDLVVHPGFRDDDAAVGVADEDRRAVLLVEDVVGGLDVALERERLVLHDADVEAVRLQDVVDALPAGAVDEASVNENHIAHVSHG
jgi:hypothetical protein